MSKLILVPTPIGNLGDITLRALEVLKQAGLILAEDTRHTRKLLTHYSIPAPLSAYHQHNEHKKLMQFVDRIREASPYVALVTDAGTPGISDPGYLLVKGCIDAGLAVESLPGATALIPALTLSGLPAHAFSFYGFLPPKKGRQTKLKQLLESELTAILYESPYKLAKLLEEIQTLGGGERQVSVSRELTKIHEETIRGTVTEVLTHFMEYEPRGEFVVVLGGKAG